MLGVMFRVSLFGESHGPCVGVLVEGCPPGVEVSEEEMNRELLRRSRGFMSTPRREGEEVFIASGVFRGRTTGAPIAIFLRNSDVDSRPYEVFRRRPRPGHADYVARIKYMGYHDHRGGGIFSGRITAGLVAAGSIARSLLRMWGIKIAAHTVQVGRSRVEGELSFEEVIKAEKSPVRCVDPEKSKEMMEEITRASEEEDSVGGVAEVLAVGLPVGLGEPPIDTLDGDLCKAIMMVPGVKGIEFGDGFKMAEMRGSEANDPIVLRDGRIATKTNRSGGVNGGISNGMPLRIRVAFRPTPSIRKEQRTVDLDSMREVSLKIEGRYDSCIVPRAVPVLESVVAIVLADHLLRWLSWMKFSGSGTR